MAGQANPSRGSSQAATPSWPALIVQSQFTKRVDQLLLRSIAFHGFFLLNRGDFPIHFGCGQPGGSARRRFTRRVSRSVKDCRRTHGPVPFIGKDPVVNAPRQHTATRTLFTTDGLE